MPKKFPDRDKKRWLELYENGMTDTQIAKEASCNVRTVRSGIQEARLASEARVVRDGLLRKAVCDHQDALLSLVKKTLSALVMPSPTLFVPWEGRGKMTVIQLEAATAEVRNDDAIAVTVVLNVENEPEWELLQEHLKRDPMWNALNQWRRSLGAMIEAQIALKKQTAASLEKRTGYPLVKVYSHPPELYYEPLVPLVFQATLNRISEIDVPDGTKPEASFTVDTDCGGVSHGNKGSVLAKVPEAKALEQCRRNMLKALDELTASPEAVRVGETLKALEKLKPKARRTVEEIRLLGMITGQCRICRRLGM